MSVLLESASAILNQAPRLAYEKIGIQHLETLRAIAFKTFEETFSPHNPPHIMKAYMDKAFDYGQLACELDHYQNHFYLAKQNDDVVGYFKLTTQLDYRNGHIPACIKNSHAIMLERFYLDSAHHGQGTAHRMMQECLDTANRLDYDVLWLGVWEKNYRARRFYEKWHFEPVGTHPFLMGDEVQTDLWLMRNLR